MKESLQVSKTGTEFMNKKLIQRKEKASLIIKEGSESIGKGLKIFE